VSGKRRAGGASWIDMQTKMNQFRRAIRAWPAHPLLFAIYPPLFLLATNAFELRFSDGLRALGVSACLAVLLLGIALVVFRNAPAAAVFSTILLAAGFSYGHVYEWGRQVSPWAFEVVRHRILLPLFLGLVLMLGVVLRKRKRLAEAVTPALNVASIAMLVLPMVTILRSEIEFARAAGIAAGPDEMTCEFTTGDYEYPPDVYYIVLDAYARQDVLAETYSFDNRSFLAALEEKGFYVAHDSQSNYATTGLSLGSSLNVDYLTFPEEMAAGENPTRHWPSLTRNLVRRQLECLGYQIVAFDSGYYWSGWRDADIFLSPTQGREERMALSGLNAFEALLANTTILRAAVDATIALPPFMIPEITQPLREHGQRILFALDTLEGPITEIQSPKFVFAHIVSPHPPYLFDRDGGWRDLAGPFTLAEGQDDRPGELQAYPAQVEFISSRILRVMDSIQRAYPDDRQPVILLQADHGLGSTPEDRMRILSAYYLPHGGAVHLYPTITPVNSFRLVFKHYFGSSLELLPDVSCYSTYDHLYDFRVLPNPAAPRPLPEGAVDLCR
jgi:hypothetical protein